jgi:hypothetical protein
LDMSSTGKREYLREEMGVESEVREQRKRERERRGEGGQCVEGDRSFGNEPAKG